jgi:hypothetical protein
VTARSRRRALEPLPRTLATPWLLLLHHILPPSAHEVICATAGASFNSLHHGRHIAGQANRYPRPPRKSWMQLTGGPIASIKRILNLNAPITDIDAQDDSSHEATTSADGAVWKVLVFDEMGRDVISSVLRVNDLRSSGV